MAAKQPTRHQRADMLAFTAPERRALAELLFAHFDRLRWWEDQEMPWRRLSSMVTNSPQNVERWLRGSMPGRNSVEALSHVLNVPARTIQYVLDHNELPPDDEEPLAPTRARLCTAITRLSEADCGVLLAVAERLLGDQPR